MRVIEVTLYSYSELSEEAKEKAYQEWSSNDHYGWYDENDKSIKGFAKLFPIKLTEWGYGGNRSDGVSYRFEHDYFDKIRNMSGRRLAKWLWNNVADEIFTGKYFGAFSRPISEPRIFHKKLKHSKLSHPERHYYQYYGIRKEVSCPFSGMMVDTSLLNPLVKFMGAPDPSTTFKDLLDECFEQWVSDCTTDVEYSSSEEAFKDAVENNEYEFNQDGTFA